MKLRLSRRALSDIDSIREASLERWGKAQTKLYMRNIREGLAHARRHPLRCSPASDFPSEFRKTRAGAHLIYFFVEGDTVHIARVLHDRADTSGAID